MSARVGQGKETVRTRVCAMGLLGWRKEGGQARESGDGGGGGG